MQHARGGLPRGARRTQLVFRGRRARFFLGAGEGLERVDVAFGNELADGVELLAPRENARVGERVPKLAGGLSLFGAGHEPRGEAREGAQERLETCSRFGAKEQMD